MKKFIYIAAISLAAMLSLSACEKTPDDGGNGNDTGKPGEAKPVREYAVSINKKPLFDLKFTNDAEGRIKQCKTTTFGEGANDIAEISFEYGNNTIQAVISENSIKTTKKYTLENGLVTGCSYKREMTDSPDFSEYGNFSYKYDQSGYLTEITHSIEKPVQSSVKTSLEWENGRLKSWYEECYNKNDMITFRCREVFHYGDALSGISNFNSFNKTLATNVTNWDFEYMYNLLGKQCNYLPVKQETYLQEYFEDGIKPGDPEDDFEEIMQTIVFDYTFDKDGTLSIATLSAKSKNSELDFQYTFKY